MRKKAMSKGNNTCEAEALATTMNDAHNKTVVRAAKRPMV
jgi:hypothetical protein